MGLKCQIHLEKPPDGAYAPGSVVRGYVQYSVAKDTQFEKIMLALKGKSECSWKENSRNESNNRSRFNAQEQLIDMDTNILTDPTGTVLAGVHAAAFQFTIPHNVPPSIKFNGDGGSASVSYCIRLKFFYSGLFSFPQTFRTEIRVINMIVATLPVEPVTYGLQDTLTRKFGFVGPSDNVDLKVTISKPFLGPGENAELCIQVTNNSKCRIQKLVIALFQTITLTDEVGRQKQISKEIKECRQKTERVRRRDYACMYSTIPIPSDLYTMQGSKILTRDYKLVVTMSLRSVKTEHSLDIPLAIGQYARDRAEDFTDPEVPNDDFAAMPRNIFGSTSALVVNNNNFIVNNNNNNMMVNPRVPEIPDAPPSYWELMNKDSKFL